MILAIVYWAKNKMYGTIPEILPSYLESNWINSFSSDDSFFCQTINIFLLQYFYTIG